MQADFSPQKQANPPTLEFFFLAMLFSNHQDRDEGWFDLFFPPLLQLSSSLFGLYRVNSQYFHTTTPFWAVYFLKISKVLSVPHTSASQISAPSSGFSLLWHLPDFLLGSWLSSHHNSLFNHILSSYDLCSISFTGGDELNLAHNLNVP